MVVQGYILKSRSMAFLGKSNTGIQTLLCKYNQKLSLYNLQFIEEELIEP